MAKEGPPEKTTIFRQHEKKNGIGLLYETICSDKFRISVQTALENFITLEHFTLLL